MIGGCGTLVAIYLRRALHETTTEESRSQKHSDNLKELLTKHTKAVVVIACFASEGSLTFHTLTTYMQKYLITTTGFDKQTARTIMTAALFIFILFQPIAGIIADEIRTKTLRIIWSILSATFIFPGLWIISNTHNI